MTSHQEADLRLLRVSFEPGAAVEGRTLRNIILREGGRAAREVS